MNRPALQLVTESNDQRLESMISEAKERMVEAEKQGDQAWTQRWAVIMVSLIRERSPEQIQRLERKAGR